MGKSNRLKFAFTKDWGQYEVRKDDKYGLYIRKINFMECEI